VDLSIKNCDFPVRYVSYIYSYVSYIYSGFSIVILDFPMVSIGVAMYHPWLWWIFPSPGSRASQGQSHRRPQASPRTAALMLGRKICGNATRL